LRCLPAGARPRGAVRGARSRCRRRGPPRGLRRHPGADQGGLMGRRLIVEADGGSRGNPGLAGCGAVVRDADTGEVLAERAEQLGVATNNVAEYQGLIEGLRAARGCDPAAVTVRMDSKLVVEQMVGN